MLALNVSIACESRGLSSCEVAIRGLLRKSCTPRACHRVVPATWEMGGRVLNDFFFVVLVGCGGLRVPASS